MVTNARPSSLQVGPYLTLWLYSISPGRLDWYSPLYLETHRSREWVESRCVSPHGTLELWWPGTAWLMLANKPNQTNKTPRDPLIRVLPEATGRGMQLEIRLPMSNRGADVFIWYFIIFFSQRLEGVGDKSLPHPRGNSWDGSPGQYFRVTALCKPCPAFQGLGSLHGSCIYWFLMPLFSLCSPSVIRQTTSHCCCCASRTTMGVRTRKLLAKRGNPSLTLNCVCRVFYHCNQKST